MARPVKTKSLQRKKVKSRKSKVHAGLQRKKAHTRKSELHKGLQRKKPLSQKAVREGHKAKVQKVVKARKERRTK